MLAERQCEDAWLAGVVVIGGVSGVLSLCCLPSPFSSDFGYPVRTKSILLGCPPRLVQMMGAKGTLVSDFISSFLFEGSDLCVFPGRQISDWC